jgi:RHS repeat-associated protein
VRRWSCALVSASTIASALTVINVDVAAAPPPQAPLDSRLAPVEFAGPSSIGDPASVLEPLEPFDSRTGALEESPRGSGLDHGDDMTRDEVLAGENARTAGDAPAGFVEGSSVEDASARTEYSTTFANPDGSRTTIIDDHAVHYLDGTRWERIDARLRRRGNAWETTASSRIARFSNREVQLSSGRGRVSFAPRDRTLPEPLVSSDGLIVTYPQVWPGVDLRYRLGTDYVKEELVVASATSIPSDGFTFDVNGPGLRLDEGRLRIEGALGNELFFSGVEVLDAAGTPISAPEDVAVELARKGANDRGRIDGLTIGVDAEWVASLPEDAFPIVVDPSNYWGPFIQNATANGGWWCPGNPFCNHTRVGNSLAGGDRYWRTGTSYDYSAYVPTATVESQLYSASLLLTHRGGVTFPQPIAVRWATSYDWCGIHDGNNCAWGYRPYLPLQELGTGSIAYDVRDWVGQTWVPGGTPVGFMMTSLETSGVYNYKELDTALILTYDRQPKIAWTSPGNGHTQHQSANGMVLSAGTHGADPDGQATYYRFWVCQNADANWGNCALAPNGDSGWQTSSQWAAWAPGPGLTAWFYNKTLRWAVEVTGTPTPGPNDVVLRSGWSTWTLFNNSIAAPPLVSPVDGFTWSPPATATLTAGSVAEPDGDALWYRFVVRERGAVGVSTKSGWLAVSGGNVSWAIPTDAPLVPGLAYEWTVEWQDGPTYFHQYFYQGSPQGQQSQDREAVFDQRLGTSGPSPLHTMGPITVNLANGNVVTSVDTVTQGTATGALGANLVYNSKQVGSGLRGRYTGGNGFVMERIDPTLNFSWEWGGPSPTAPVDHWSVTWTGWITVPTTGDYRFGAGADDNVSVIVDGNTVLNTSCCSRPDAPAAMPSTYFRSDGAVVNGFQEANNQIGTWSSHNFTAGMPQRISVTFTEATASAWFTLFVREPSGVVNVVPSSWLTPDASPLPAGWSLDASAGQDARYVGATVESDQILLTSADGSVDTYVRGADSKGFVPPPGELDTVTTLADGRVQVLASDGGVYEFGTSGQLVRYTPAVDAGLPTTPTTSWATLPGSTAQRLVSQTDPVSGRSLTYVYHGLGACPSSPAGYEQPGSAALNGLLCRVTRADGQSTSLFYNIDTLRRPRLERVDNPGGQIALLRWEGGRLLSVRSPYQSDLVNAGQLGNTGDADWLLGWSGEQLVSVAAPKASASATTREGITITWVSASETTVEVAHLDALNGAAAWDRRVQFDGRARWTAEWLARGPTVAGSVSNSVERTASWDGADRMVTTKANGRTTGFLYDSRGWLTETYGPANASCFNGAVPNGTCANPAVSRTKTSYDTVLLPNGSEAPMNGLAATYFSTPSFTGVPAGVATVNGANGFAVDWSTGAPRPGAPVDGWSARLTGEISLPIPGRWGFWITLADGVDQAALYIDDKPVIVLASSPCAQGCTLYGTTPGSIAHGRHRIRLDFVDNGGGASVQLNWDRPLSGNQVVPSTAVTPRYGLPTRTIEYGSGTITQQRYDSGGWDPAHGLVTDVVQDPAGLALTTSTSYETTYRRRAARTLPSGATTTYSYYGNTEGAPTVACADGTTIAGGTSQGGLLNAATSPTPASGAAVVEQTVYDQLGRPVATRIGNEPWTCTTYDDRGRVTRVVHPANASAPARTVTTTFNDTVLPQRVVVSDSTGSVTTDSDFLGRTVRYVDVWGVPTTTEYDAAGRVTRRSGAAIGATSTSPGLQYGYDRGGFVTQVRLDGGVIAHAAYTAGVSGGDLESVTYPYGAGNAGNGTRGSFVHDFGGRMRSITWSNVSTGALIGSDLVQRSGSGQVTNSAIDGSPVTWSYVYDSVGRLTRAIGLDHDYQYEYASSGGCGPAPAAGRNSNRTRVTDNGEVIATSCYDHADRLTSTTAAGATGTISYDAHGNTTVLGGQTLVYDQADRHLGTYLPSPTNPASWAANTRDATDRLVSRSAGSTSSISTRGASSASTTSSTASSLTVGRPSGVVSGDFMLASIATTGTVTVTPPAGWSPVASSVNGTSVRVSVFSRRATSGDAATYTFATSGPSSISGGVVAYVDVHSTAVDASATRVSASSTSQTAAGVTTTGPNRKVVSVYAVASSTSFTMPAEQVERYDRAATTSPPLTLAHADRHRSSPVTTSPVTAQVGTPGPGAAVTIALRPTVATSAQRYIHTGPGDAVAAVATTTGQIIERLITLPGGVTVTLRNGTTVWAYPNIHGDITATANTTGTRTSGPHHYDPFGTPLTTHPDTTNGNADHGWLGQHHRLRDHTTGLTPIIHMGARPYLPTLGRFLEPDPIEGGCANDYTYVTDPINDNDLDGLKSRRERCRDAAAALTKNRNAKLARIRDYAEDAFGLPERGKNSRRGHLNAIHQLDKRIEVALRNIKKYCDDPRNRPRDFQPPNAPPLGPLLMVAGLGAAGYFLAGGGLRALGR